MENKIVKTKESRSAIISTSKGTKMIFSEDDIRRRAFEIYLETKNSSATELDNWYYAERELTGYYK